jgi:probable HAF family extracellular repeat protein
MEGKTMTLRLTGLLAAIFVAAAGQSLAQTYRLTDLGAVRGELVSKGYSLNDLGQAAGTSSNPSGAIATLFSGGQAISLGTLEPGDPAIATGINKSAEVVGYEPFYSTSGAIPHAFLYSGGTLSDIHSPVLFPTGTSAAAINGSGVVVGQGNLNSWNFHAFIYSRGQMVDIGPPGAYQASAAGINDAGDVTGNAFFTNGGGGPFIYSNGRFTYLTAPSGTSISALAISSTGKIAGTIYFNSGSPPHAALYSNGVWTDLGGVTGAVATHGTGINAVGQVIATAYYPVQSYHPFVPGKHVAYTVRNGNLVNLNTLIPPNSGYTVTDSIAINDSGDILCDATGAAGKERAVLLTPN